MFRGHTIFLGPFHNFLASKWAVFSRGGSLSEICGQNLRNVGRTVVVMIIYQCIHWTLRLQLFCPHFWDSAHIFQKGIYINIEWLWLLDVIICTHQCTMISRLIVISPFQVCWSTLTRWSICKLPSQQDHVNMSTSSYMNKRGFNRRVSKLSDLKEYKNNRHWKLLGGSCPPLSIYLTHICTDVPMFRWSA